ncbi:DUF6443 domain-containing protein [Emticicia sp. C21]|uniref:DUF6443 domain-containing protein n=1 Tax=Emticicia sp. C21 TaxID=2302915 RepID=UPI000E356583|nr:DUF6443 domain-containing protein [Emticicia sp. C21]RFS15553.1 hypothetical protein D0T08_15495 [Emticicia sp. C21]
MKKNLILWLLLPLCSWGQSITNHKNAVVHSSFRVSGATTADASDATKALISIQYMDGLGHPLQTVGYRQSPTAKDIVFEGKTYDAFSRPFKTALTAPTAVQTGEYQANPSGLATTFYGDSYSYSEMTAFDNSPLNRLRVQYGAGQAWRTNTKNIQTFDEIAGTAVRLYNSDPTGNITLSGTYTANTLYKTRVIDEQGNTIVEIKDKSGNLIQREQPVGAETLITYYVYDEWQRLRAVIQPEGYALNASITKNSATWNSWVFGYTYDAAGRLIEKHTPGGGWQYIVYDKNDLPVLTQDASQTALSKWSFNKYDAFGRTIIKGELDNASSRATLQTSFDGMSTTYETWLGVSGYSNSSFPVSYGSTAEKFWNFYDSYEWIAGEWAFNSGTAYNSTNYYSNSKGLQSGSFARNQETPSKVFHSVFYYDFKGRMMQSYRVHDKGGASPWTKPVVTNLGYNFAGEVVNEKVLYQVDGMANTESLATYEYDNTGRRLRVSHGINTAVSEVRRSDYDEAGRLKQAKIRATGTYTANGTSISGLQTTDYTYHLRGQLRGINLDGSGNPVPNASQGDLFSYKLDYETAGYYDGNIGKQYWQASTNNAPAGIRFYTFTYDAASRLKSAAYTGISSESYSLPTVNYDKNGNITSLQRNGKLTSTYGLMDNLSYTYTGNRLMRVEDGVTGDYDVDFVNRNSGTDDYSYYANGALKADKNEAINDIIYSTYVNQPIEMQLTSSRWIKNSYDGAGRLYKTSYSTGEYWEYLDGLVFKNGAFYQLATPEGRAVYQSGAWSYEYFHTDHLGNTRVAYKANGTALTKTSETSFDPWGVVLNGINLLNSYQNRFEFLNREKESTFNLRYIRLNARGYNPTIGRFDRVDPVLDEQEQYSTYQYGWNNPVLRNDPNGECPNCLTALGGFLLKGGIELGGQLLSGKNLNEVDWADVGVEAVKGAVIGSGVGAVTAGIVEVGSIAAKSTLDISKKDGVKTTFNGSKSIAETGFDAVADVAGGKIAGKIGGGITKGVEKSAVRLVAESNTANRAASIAKTYANETGKASAKTLANNLAKEATVANVKQQVVSSTAKVSKSVIGDVTQNTYENKFTDAVKKLFGF